MKFIQSSQAFYTENGEVLTHLDFTYYTYGTLNAEKTNCIWICHALTADANAGEWWQGLIGPGKVIDTNKYFVVCSNNLGSCYGATNPRSINPKTGKEYGRDFPVLTIKDQAKAQDVLRKILKINSIYLLVGGSTGGQQVLEWAIEKPLLFENICVLATNARHSAWGIAYNEAQRMAIEADPTLYSNQNGAGEKGLQAARALAMLSYRTYEAYNATQTEKNIEKTKDFRASSYQRYQGRKLTERFDALAYVTLSKIMDTHNVGRGQTSIAEALGRIKAPTLVIGIESDNLFPPEEQQFLAKHIPKSRLEIIESDYGHDGFLTEVDKISDLLASFLAGDMQEQVKKEHFALPGTELF